jgi:hypothetical protein
MFSMYRKKLGGKVSIPHSADLSTWVSNFR